MKKLVVKVLNEKVRQWGLPKRGSAGSAGLDLMACLETSLSLLPGERSLIPTGIAIHLADPQMAALILSRSGLGAKKGLTVAQGVGLIDSDYTGELKVMLLNTSKETQTVEPGDRIAQLVVTPIFTPELVEVESLEETERGASGFGSTGVQSNPASF